MATKTLKIKVKKDAGVTDFWLSVGHKDIPTVESPAGTAKGTIDLESPASHTLIYFVDGAADATIKITATVDTNVIFEQTGRMLPVEPPHGFGNVTFSL